ncbi:MAG: adenine deaminase [Clostridia bacterium]|nr:adenine deaminase [Clostridia bacterium]
MTTLLKNGRIVNVFTDCIEEANVLIRDKKIVGAGDYTSADNVVDVGGRIICPAFIDSHFHIESTMLMPRELAKVCVPHGTAAIVADPHEIANVCGADGIRFFMESSAGMPMRFYYTLPSCVPATANDENGAVLTARELEPFYKYDRVLGLAEMMNYPGVIMEDPMVLDKLQTARHTHKIINGHAPLLGGRDLDKYIAQGIQDDHECSNIAEAKEKLGKGQWIMIREGTSARNLAGLIDLFDEPYNRRCVLATDDEHPYDLMTKGHIDRIIREAAALGKNPLIGIRMATIQAATCMRMPFMGAVAPGYFANILVLNDLDTVDVADVYHSGKLVCKDKEMLPVELNEIDTNAYKAVYSSVNIDPLTEENFRVVPEGEKCRVIRAIPGELLTNEEIAALNFSKDNGVDVEKDIIKLAVCERHHFTGHIGLGYIAGLGIKRGAIASTVSHDSHKLVVVGTNEADMAAAGNHLASIGGGLCVVLGGKVLADLPLPVAGIVSEKDAPEVAEENRVLREAVRKLGVAEGIEPFMNTAFISLSVIPNLKMTTKGLLDVNSQVLLPLFI